MSGSGDYISREAAFDAVFGQFCASSDETEAALNSAVEDIKSIPAADVRPVRRGKWIGYPECIKYANAYSDDHIVCSACEECFSILDNDCERFNFCPNCGADMRET
jgi:hypothetical protein